MNVSMHGWNSINVLFRVIAKEQHGDVELFKCVSIKGDEFYLENSSFFLGHTANSSSYISEEKVSLSEIIFNLQNNLGIFEVTFYKVDGEERTIRGYAIGPDKNFGYTRVYDLDSSKVKNVNNRGIKQLILNNVKYYV